MIFDTYTPECRRIARSRQKKLPWLLRWVWQMNIVGLINRRLRVLGVGRWVWQLYATIGWHPTEAGTYTEEIELSFLTISSHPGCALGWNWIDYHWWQPKRGPGAGFRRRFSYLRAWFAFCCPYPWCAGRYLWDYQERGVGPRWNHASFLVNSWMGREVCRAWYDHFLLRCGDFRRQLISKKRLKSYLWTRFCGDGCPYLAPVPKRVAKQKTAYTAMWWTLSPTCGMTTEELAAMTAKCSTNFGLTAAMKEKFRYRGRRARWYGPISNVISSETYETRGSPLRAG